MRNGISMRLHSLTLQWFRAVRIHALEQLWGSALPLVKVLHCPGLLLLLCKVGEINHHHPANLGECLLSVCFFICIFCFDPHSNLKEIFLSSPFYRWGSKGTVRLSNVPKVLLLLKLPERVSLWKGRSRPPLLCFTDDRCIPMWVWRSGWLTGTVIM